MKTTSTFILIATFILTIYSTAFAEQINTIIGVVEDSENYIHADEEKLPIEVYFQFIDGRKFVMYSEKYVIVVKNTLYKVYLSNSSENDRKVVCRIDQLNIPIMSNGVLANIELKVPITNLAIAGKGCN